MPTETQKQAIKYVETAIERCKQEGLAAKITTKFHNGLTSVEAVIWIGDSDPEIDELWKQGKLPI